MADTRAVILAYRHLYREGLKAIRYSTPARHLLRETLRSAFRSGSLDDYDSQRVEKTLIFLQQAGTSTGFEHKILRNLLTVRFWEQPVNQHGAKLYVWYCYLHRSLVRTFVVFVLFFSSIPFSSVCFLAAILTLNTASMIISQLISI
jgi:hypothetical protein